MNRDDILKRGSELGIPPTLVLLLLRFALPVILAFFEQWAKIKAETTEAESLSLAPKESARKLLRDVLGVLEFVATKTPTDIDDRAVQTLKSLADNDLAFDFVWGLFAK